MRWWTGGRQVTENSLRTLEAAGFYHVPVVQGAAVALDGTYYDPRKGERVLAPPRFEVSASLLAANESLP